MVKPMMRPSQYNEHQESQKRFQTIFNSIEPLDITMNMKPEDDFLNDGHIDLWGVRVNYDWEKRRDWERTDGRFQFEKLSQFTRKFEKRKEIELALQCNKVESYIASAWHKDFSQYLHYFPSKTDYNFLENVSMRMTDKFIVTQIKQVTTLKNWLLKTYQPRQVENFKLTTSENLAESFKIQYRK